MCCNLHAVLDLLTAWRVPEALLRAHVCSAKAQANFRLGAGQSVVLLCAEWSASVRSVSGNPVGF